MEIEELGASMRTMSPPPPLSQSTNNSVMSVGRRNQIAYQIIKQILVEEHVRSPGQLFGDLKEPYQIACEIGEAFKIPFDDMLEFIIAVIKDVMPEKFTEFLVLTKQAKQKRNAEQEPSKSQLETVFEEILDEHDHGEPVG